MNKSDIDDSIDLKIETNKEQLNKIEKYVLLLKEHNEKFNLYSKNAYPMLPFHIEDSQILSTFCKNNKTILDLGSGGGLPSVILAIMKPESLIIAVESKPKKANFINHVAQKLDLENLEVWQDDVNSLNKNEYIYPHIITAKAFKHYSLVFDIIKKLAYPNIKLFIPISSLQHDTLTSLDSSSFELINIKNAFFYIYTNSKLMKNHSRI